jgi:hypothetical protein
MSCEQSLEVGLGRLLFLAAADARSRARAVGVAIATTLVAVDQSRTRSPLYLIESMRIVKYASSSFKTLLLMDYESVVLILARKLRAPALAHQNCRRVCHAV